MGVKDYFKDIFNVNEFEPEIAEEEIEEEAPVKKETAPKKVIERRSYRAAQATEQGSAMKVVLVRPEVFNDVANVADHLKLGKTIVLNLETASREVSRRIVDFMSGAAYALNCKLKKVANNTFIIVPESTDIAGELLLDDFGEENYFM